jgi:hypothetical protein
MLLAESSVVVLLIATGWLGMAHLGNYSLASESDPHHGKAAPDIRDGTPRGR